MKKSITAVLGVSVVIALGMYVSRPKAEPVSPEAAAEVAPAQEAEPAPMAERVDAHGDARQPVEDAKVAAPATRALAVTSSPEPDTAFVQRTVDSLVSPKANYLQKREAWKQLRDAGKLDQAIADLEQRKVNDPGSAEYPAALGQAYLKKCAALQDVREQGILAMQADKLFDTALSLDPSNWEARFTKAVGMSYWPPVLNKGDEVIQHFQTLIEQQEAQAPLPQFAETYAWLGEQYQKAGKSDDARAVWQRGAALFPANDKLREKLAGEQ